MGAKIYGHRGAMGEKPENSIAGFLHARSVGAAGVETDVVLTRDLVPVLHHDLHLLEGRAIAALGLDDLPGHIPTLAAALRAVDGIEWLLEIKRPFDQVGNLPPPAVLAERIAEQLIDADPTKLQIWSFDLELVLAFGRQLPGVTLGCFTGNRTDIAANSAAYLGKDYRASEISAALGDAGITCRGAFHALWTNAEILSAKAAGLKTFACFVNETDDFYRLRNLVDGIITDWPSRFA